ncbi:MAG: cytochrome P450, partial [Nitriliruptorales bacterium]|nr:cytochrome P450 [Nitriliruptorales bacterium]
VAPTVFFEQPAHVLVTWEAVRETLRDDDHVPGAPTYELSTRPTLGHTFIDASGDEHRRLRKLTTPAFRSRSIERFDADQLVRLGHEIVDRFADRGEGDLVTEFTTVMPYLAIARKLGLPESREEDTRRWARGLLSGAFDEEAAATAAAEFNAHLGDVLAARRTGPADDVLSAMAAIRDEDGTPLTDDEILSHVRLLFAVGASTTAHGMASLLSLLLRRPDMLDRALADPDWRDGVVEEALRFEPPVSILPRVLLGPTTVFGHDLPANSFLLVGIAGANRDPAAMEDPDTFDPDRPAVDVLTFGSGSKFCAGAHLARRELRVALDVLLDRLPGLRLTSTDGIEPAGGPLRSPVALPAGWDA